MSGRRTAWISLIVVVVVLSCCVLNFNRDTNAAPQRDNQPFANAVEQRAAMIAELKAIRVLIEEQNTLLKEQNTLLGSGKMKVSVTQGKQK